MTTVQADHAKAILCIAVVLFLPSMDCLSVAANDGAANPRPNSTGAKQASALAAAEKPAALQEAASKSDDQLQQQENPDGQDDSFALPKNASAKELFEFIEYSKQNRGKTVRSVAKSARAVAAAAKEILDRSDVKLADETRAAGERLRALSFLSRYDSESRRELSTLVKTLENDPRVELSRLAAIEGFRLQLGAVREASKKEQQQLVDQLKTLIADNGLDRELFTLASGLAREIGYSKNVHIAASLYDNLAEMIAESDDELLRSRVDKMLGTARRVRLPGNFMDMQGTTTDGQEFHWSDYRGRVVLVDFWASWCSPCRAEVPHMKRALERYQEKGFEIVGVNLDRTLTACRRYMDREGITWPSLMSDSDDQRGWDNPLATQYGISAIPTAILVDRDGHVVSLRARGNELDRLLEEMLGPIEPTAADRDVAGEGDVAGDGQKSDESESLGKAKASADDEPHDSAADGKV